MPFTPSVEPARLVLTALNLSEQRVYSLTPVGIHLEIHRTSTPSPTPFVVPILLDPWVRFSPGWADRFHLTKTPYRLSWSYNDTIAVQISSSVELFVETFQDSRQYLSITENPNLDYPIGHSLPFPAILIKGLAAGDFTLDIQTTSHAFPLKSP
jgi:hypothetical protein